jgi:hypothetical protein
MNSRILYLPNREIDKSKWDTRIATASNGLIYAYSFYLDTMAKNWDALVLDDYEAVMPLTGNRKYGFYYLYQPAFTASLGIFSSIISEELVSAFIQAIPEKFRLVEISLNTANNFPSASSYFYQRINYTLDLHKDYNTIFNIYRDNHKRNIARAAHLGCRVSREISADDVISLCSQQMKHPGAAKEQDYSNFKKLYEFLATRKEAEVYGMVDSQNRLLASCIFFFSHNRAYYILVGNHPDGRTLGASHALIDAFIKDYAGSEMILDFEGSDIRNLAFFYSGFGAREEMYPALKINRLPWYVRLFKK